MNWTSGLILGGVFLVSVTYFTSHKEEKVEYKIGIYTKEYNLGHTYIIRHDGRSSQMVHNPDCLECSQKRMYDKT